MKKDVKVVIRKKKEMGGAGFGVPLIFAGMEKKEIPYTLCEGAEIVGKLCGVDSDLFKAAELLFMQEGAPEKIAIYGGVGNSLSCLPTVWEQEWRQLIVVSRGREGENTLGEIARYLEAKGDKIYFCSVQNLDELKAGKNAIIELNRTYCMYYPLGEKCPEAAVVGVSAGKKAGSISYKNQILKGLEPVVLTEKEKEGVECAGCYSYVKKCGDNVTSEGKVGSGEYLDIIDATDFVVGEIENRTQKTLNRNDKIPFDNNGIALLEAVCVNVLQEAFNNGIIAVDEDGMPDYTVNYAPRSETLLEDRAQRRYLEGKFRFGLAGAVHVVEINGTIEI